MAKAIEEVDRSGVNYRLTDMGTLLEGDWDAVMGVIRKVQARLLEETDRIYITISADIRKDKDVRLGDKIRGIQKKLGAGS